MTIPSQPDTADLKDKNFRSLAQTIAVQTGLALYPRSIAATPEAVYFLGRQGNKRYICAWGTKHGLKGEAYSVWFGEETVKAILCSAESSSLAQLRKKLGYLRPVRLGLVKLIGLGDRLGLATPGHVQAVQLGDMAPIFAQPSVRENRRTSRTPQEVLDDATLGVFQEGWTAGFGADADHVKYKDDIDTFIEAGYSFYTFDAGDHVNDQAHTASPAALKAGYEALPWPALASSAADTLYTFTHAPIYLGDRQLVISSLDLHKAAVKYSRAVAHTVTLAHHPASKCLPDTYEIEMSVDKTNYPTSPAEHFYIACELQRLGVKPISLAPRYSGRFEKGVDFIGSTNEFAAEFELHMAIARLTNDGLIHLKTAGTSYHISAEIAQAPNPQSLPDDQLAVLLDNFHIRQILHVTYGSVLQDAELKSRLLSTLKFYQPYYNKALLAHFSRHIQPFKDEVK
jgi:hypothetical protein